MYLIQVQGLFDCGGIWLVNSQTFQMMALQYLIIFITAMHKSQGNGVWKPTRIPFSRLVIRLKFSEINFELTPHQVLVLRLPSQPVAFS